MANILLVGTVDTKADELLFMRERIEALGGKAILMDVGVLGSPAVMPDVSASDVADASGMPLEKIRALGDENEAMTQMAIGASGIATRLYAEGRIHGVLALGGTMGTDLALDVCAALPLGLPKFIVSTVAYSHLIPPERLAPDLMMILWAGGLYGLNSICQSILAQAAGAVLGASGAVAGLQNPAVSKKPMVAISSLGKSCLSYMVRLKPALEARGFEVAVFHCTGMGGRAMEALAEQGRFVAVLDLCLQEVANELHGSVVTSGASRLEAASRRGIPQIIAPGSFDLIDVQSWAPLEAKYQGRPYHAHNRLIGSTLMSAEERREGARLLGEKLALASGPCAFMLPTMGIEQWDKLGEPLHDGPGLAAFCDEIRKAVKPPVQMIELDAHINDDAFSNAVLQQFDVWLAQGLIKG